jgi:hypothetical protein
MRAKEFAYTCDQGLVIYFGKWGKGRRLRTYWKVGTLNK